MSCWFIEEPTENTTGKSRNNIQYCSSQSVSLNCLKCRVQCRKIFNTMSDGRKRLSGAQYKTLAEEKRRKLHAVLDKTKKLNNYFLIKPTTTTSKAQTHDSESETVTAVPIPPDNAEAMDTEPSESEYRLCHYVNKCVF